jgi:hypothetical protein
MDKILYLSCKFKGLFVPLTAGIHYPEDRITHVNKQGPIDVSYQVAFKNRIKMPRRK